LLAADLRDLSALHEKLARVGFDFSLPTLVLAECVMTYMNPDESNRVIEWAVKVFPRCIFVVYEQIVPNV
jgi:O-methyltransferase involved in polyketide biosynthesis